MPTSTRTTHWSTNTHTGMTTGTMIMCMSSCQQIPIIIVISMNLLRTVTLTYQMHTTSIAID